MTESKLPPRMEQHKNEKVIIIVIIIYLLEILIINLRAKWCKNKIPSHIPSVNKYTCSRFC